MRKTLPSFKTSASFPGAAGCTGAELSNHSSESIIRIKVPIDGKQVAGRHPGAASLVRSNMEGPSFHSRIFSLKKGCKEESEEMPVNQTSQCYRTVTGSLLSSHSLCEGTSSSCQASAATVTNPRLKSIFEKIKYAQG